MSTAKPIRDIGSPCLQPAQLVGHNVYEGRPAGESREKALLKDEKWPQKPTEAPARASVPDDIKLASDDAVPRCRNRSS